MPNLKDNHANQNFKVAIEILRKLRPDCDFILKKVYMDFGAGMMWDTIVCYYNEPFTRSYQMLSPRQWDDLYNADKPEEITAIANELAKELQGICPKKNA